MFLCLLSIFLFHRNKKSVRKAFLAVIKNSVGKAALRHLRLVSCHIAILRGRSLHDMNPQQRKSNHKSCSVAQKAMINVSRLLHKHFFYSDTMQRYNGAMKNLMFYQHLVQTWQELFSSLENKLLWNTKIHSTIHAFNCWVVHLHC